MAAGQGGGGGNNGTGSGSGTAPGSGAAGLGIPAHLTLSFSSGPHWGAAALPQSHTVRSLERALEEAGSSGILCLSGRKLRDFPGSGCDLSDTTQADLSKNRFTEIPPDVWLFAPLETLNLYHNCIKSIPESIKNLQMLTYLNISRNLLSTLPKYLFDLPLKVLVVSNNKLVSIPEEIGKLRDLMELDISCNELQVLPQQIGKLQSLRELNIRRNNLHMLPDELGDLPLVKLDFSCNKITEIPICYRKLRHLQVIVLDNNPMQIPPAQICLKGKVHIFKFLSIQACLRIDKKPDSLDLPSLGKRIPSQPLTDSMEDFYPNKNHGPDSGIGSDNGDKRLSTTEPSDDDTISLHSQVSESTREQTLRNDNHVMGSKLDPQKDQEAFDYIDPNAEEGALPEQGEAQIAPLLSYAKERGKHPEKSQKIEQNEDWGDEKRLQKEQLLAEDDDELKEVTDLRKIAAQLLQQEQKHRRRPLSYRTSFSEKLFQRTRAAGRASRLLNHSVSVNTRNRPKQPMESEKCISTNEVNSPVSPYSWQPLENQKDSVDEQHWPETQPVIWQNEERRRSKQIRKEYFKKFVMQILPRMENVEKTWRMWEYTRQRVISFLAAVLHKKGTREDIENNMPEFLLRTMKKGSDCNPKKTFLIVAPLSVLYNWKDELDTWGYFKVSVLHGSKKDDDMSRIKQGKCEVALTTYEILRLYLDEFNSIEWSAVIVDEAHRIKNPKAQITQTMKLLKCSVRIGLTGTILQNNMEELWCVMDWAVPGLLGSRVHFKKKFSDPVEHGQRHTATKRELATGRKAMVKLARKMAGWFLRRTKALISDQLPKKEDRMVFCSLTEFQKAVYQAVLETDDVTLVLRAGEPCSCNSGSKRKNCCYKVNAHGETIKSLRFSYLMILQKVANHAALLQTDNTSKLQEAHIKRVCSQVFSSFPDFVQLSKDAAFETISDPKYSGKMKVLQQLLNHFRKNKDKVLLFSFSTKLLDVLEQYCMASGLDYRRLDGNTKSEDRIRIVREFNSIQEINICLVSTMAGGLGLNFVGANVVILFDPTWNPANDLQAIDRAYRIGQHRAVKVFRLISLGTVEEMMYLRQVYKQQLHFAVIGTENARRYFEAVQGSKEHQGELFGIHNLFKLRTHGSCLTNDILEREGQVEAGVMTATTWLKEENRSCSSEKYEQPDCQEDEDPQSIQAQLKREETEFWDDFSDDDILESSVKKCDGRKPNNENNFRIKKGQLSLMQCGFSKLLQRESATTKEGDDNYSLHYSSSDDHTLRKNVNSKHGGFQKCQTSVPILEQEKAVPSPNGTGKQNMHSTDWLGSSGSEEKGNRKNEYQSISKQCDIVMETGSSSEEEDDVIFPTQVQVCQQPVLTEEVEKHSSISENCEELAKEKAGSVFKGNSRQFGFHCTESNFSNAMSFEDVKNDIDLKGASDVSDESDDIELPRNSESRKLGTLRKESGSQNIDEFSSSEDNFTVEKIHTRKQSYRCNQQGGRVQFGSKILCPIQDTSVAQMKCSSYAMHRTYGSKTEFDHQEKKMESMDKYLDGVQEVAYIHSNQNVVGSSKAENHLSRWAVRDVFELKQFSQLPANVAVCSAKKNYEVPEDNTSQKKVVKERQEMLMNSKQHHLYVMHPVTQRSKKVHRVGSTTFLIGKTPKGIRRRQFEEMVSHFNMGSVKELAEHIAKATSETRQKMLKDFYVSKHPEMESFFSLEIPAEASHNCEEREMGTTHSRKRKSIVNFGRSKSKPSSPNRLLLSGATETRTQESHKGEAEQLHKDSYLQDMFVDAKYKQSPSVATQHIQRRNSQAFKDFMASGSLSSKSEIIEVLPVKSCEGQPDSEGAQLPKKRSLSQSENGESKAQIFKKNSFVDLLGDTSILNEIFRSDGNGSTGSARRFSSGQAEKSKGRPKDFWDMLNEQDEESLRKLTDIAVIEKLCERAPHSTVTEERKVCESSLWKRNETFLWKKYNADD